jgi:predicted Zn-ribbon and HTH transcriptional regulator
MVKMIPILGYRCERCGHERVPREKNHDPKVCPKCKSPYWGTPRASAPKKKKATGATNSADKADLRSNEE